MQTFAEALDAVGLNERDSVYWAGLATLVRRPEDRPLYDRAFRVFWQQLPGGPDTVEVEVPATLAVDVAEEDGGEGETADDDEGDEDELTLRFSAVEVLRDKDFAAYTDDELAEARALDAADGGHDGTPPFPTPGAQPPRPRPPRPAAYGAGGDAQRR